MNTEVNPLASGNNVFYFNQWAKFENQEIRDCFESLTKEQALSLKRGEVVWYDPDNYHPRGKVYGFTARLITEVKKINSTTNQIVFGNNVISTERYYKLYKIKDGSKEKLLKLIAKNPEAQPKEDSHARLN